MYIKLNTRKYNFYQQKFIVFVFIVIFLGPKTIFLVPVYYLWAHLISVHKEQPP